MNFLIGFCSKHPIATFGAVIAVGGCTALPLSVKLGAVFISSGLGLVISNLAIAIFEKIARRSEQTNKSFNENHKALNQLRLDAVELGSKIKDVRSAVLTLAESQAGSFN